MALLVGECPAEVADAVRRKVPRGPGTAVELATEELGTEQARPFVVRNPFSYTSFD